MTGRMPPPGNRRIAILASVMVVVIGFPFLFSACALLDRFQRGEHQSTGVSQTPQQERQPEAEPAPNGKESEDLAERLEASEEKAAKAQAKLTEMEDQHALEIQALNQRLEAATAAKERAINEVIRLRSRIQGMADQSQAAAMSAEARVIIDQMEEEAFSDQARQMVVEARGYLEKGRKEMDEGNSGGAAYMFEQVSALYQDFRGKIDPHRLVVVSGPVTLRASPAPSGARVGTLSRGDAVVGLVKSGDWIQVRPPSGPPGWLKANTVR